MTTIRTSAIAFTAAIAMTAAASLGAPAQAHANNGGAFVGGLVAGAIIGTALTRPVYAAPAYGVVYEPVQHCWMQKEFVGYNYKGQKMYQKVQVCE